MVLFCDIVSDIQLLLVYNIRDHVIMCYLVVHGIIPHDGILYYVNL